MSKDLKDYKDELEHKADEVGSFLERNKKKIILGILIVLAVGAAVTIIGQFL